MNRRKTVTWTGLAVPLLLSCAVSLGATGPTYKEVELKESGTIVGVVTFNGAIPKPAVLEITGDDKICHEQPILSEDLVVSDDRKVKWAVVTLKGLRRGKAFPKEDPDNPIVFDQKGCRFDPHVVVVPAGRKLQIRNSDGILHNVHPLPKKNAAFNKAMPPQVKTLDAKFKRRERIPVKCDVHPWMRGWIIVVDNPYHAVTDSDGSFRMDKVPVGKHKLEVWHETLGKQVIEVHVEAGKEARVEFVFEVK